MKQKMMSSGVADEGATIDEAYYMLVRELGYRWKDVMEEYVPQTLYTLERLEEEGKKRKRMKKKQEKKVKN